jgi:N6-L-threonylcarbamoyladenine synthase
MGFAVLGIETSCDDTAASIIQDETVLSNVVSSQLVHAEYGGVVPELASRNHQLYISRVVDQALKDAAISLQDLDGVAYTQGPGLLGSLLVGAQFAKGLSMSLKKPLLPVDHLKAHVLCHLIDDPKPEFPFLCLLVSGGHTHIILVEDEFSLTTIGKTLDDAAGEAFDKTAKMLGLPYPGGPLIDQHAQSGESVFNFPETNVPDFNYSFSGLKTAILQFLNKEVQQNERFIPEHLSDICASVQSHIVDYLVSIFVKAAKNYQIKRIALAGGVSANSYLRSRFNDLAESGFEVYIPAFEYCTDNAAMVAKVGELMLNRGSFGTMDDALFTKSSLS